MAGTIYRADTLDELADLLGYKGAAKQNFLDSIAHYNELCYAGVDSDYGKDAPYMVPSTPLRSSAAPAPPATPPTR